MRNTARCDTGHDQPESEVTIAGIRNKSARGNKQSGQDWLRAARAIQGRDRWNVGQLAIKLGIPCPSDWKRPNIVSTADEAPLQLLEYPQSHHMIATSPNNDRAGLAFILRAARNETSRPGSVLRMVSRMCDETIKADIELIKLKHAYKLANSLNEGMTPEDRERLAGKQFAHCTFAIAEYRATTYSYMYPALSGFVSAPAPQKLELRMSTEIGKDLSFC